MLELTPERIALALMGYVVLLFSLSVHESAHGWMALRMGDDTAARQGRITLNPLSHIDPFGTVLIPLLQFLYSGIPLLGWAKPTPVGAHNFRRLARGHVLVALAGPALEPAAGAPVHGRRSSSGSRFLGCPRIPASRSLIVTLLDDRHPDERRAGALQPGAAAAARRLLDRLLGPPALDLRAL